MRVSRTLLATVKETPADAEIVSHRLMLRAGLVRQLASGLYSWLPLGWRVVRKVERIVREEMDRAGALEMIMPGVQPAELWQESGRWEEYGPELLRLKDRHERDFCLGPTHEEVVTDIARREIRSYKQLPINLYQVQTKFRDEVRPRFGVMRAREFIMKDAYSFDLDWEGLRESYRAMHDAYVRVFTRTGLAFRVVDADSGAIGGSRSQEFHVLAESGEDEIAFSDGGFAANVELIACPAPPGARAAPAAPMAPVDTPGVRSMRDLARYLDVPLDLSKVFFIATANYMERVPPALRDRMEVIFLSSYTRREKLQIARQYLVPRQMTDCGLTAEQISFTDAAPPELAEPLFDRVVERCRRTAPTETGRFGAPMTIDAQFDGPITIILSSTE